MTKDEAIVYAGMAYLTNSTPEIIEEMEENPDDICKYAWEPLEYYSNKYILDAIDGLAHYIQNNFEKL